MFDTIYSWCRNNSVDLELVCSGPPKFKGKPWSNCNKAVCGGQSTDFTDEVEKMPMYSQKLSDKAHENYVDSMAPSSFEKQIQYQQTEYDWTFAYAAWALIVVFVILVIVGVFMWCGLKPLQSSRKGSAHIDLEVQSLQSLR
jgi:hypothetical protein